MPVYVVDITLVTDIEADSQKEAKGIAEDIGNALRTMVEYAKDVKFVETEYKEYGEIEWDDEWDDEEEEG